MSNVYKRNRSPSQYAMYLITKCIKHELFEMGNVKDQCYFPKEHKTTYYSLLKNCDEITKYLTSIYTLKTELKEKYIVIIENIDKSINLSETCVQLLQNHYKDMKLYSPTSKRMTTVSKRIQKITFRFIELSDKLRKYKKGIKQKIKKYNNNKKLTS